MSWLIYSMNILIRCRCWDSFLYGALNLYSWPWMHIWRCVMMEESCPTTQGYRGNNICYVCISWNEPVLHAQDDTLTQIKKRRNILDLCVTHGGFWSSSLTCDASLTLEGFLLFTDEYWMEEVKLTEKEQNFLQHYKDHLEMISICTYLL